MKMKQTECSETSAYIIQAPGNYPEESIQHSEHGESLKSRSICAAMRLLSKCLFILVVNRYQDLQELKSTVMLRSIKLINDNRRFESS
jgi:accessory gene regulator protein AgrB